MSNTTSTIHNPTTWSDHDFLAFEGFVSKVHWEHSYSYAVENYPPEFESPELQALADDPAKLRTLYLENRQKVEDWYDQVGGQRACDLHNDHVDEERRRRRDACLFGIRCTDGFVITAETQEGRDRTAADLLAHKDQQGWRAPTALLAREVPGGEWTEVRAV